MEGVKDFIEYFPDTGKLMWKKSNSNKVRVGQEITHVDSYGYLGVQFQFVRWKAHRLAWYLYYGEVPEGDIDHINGDRTDNRIENLRLASRGENLRNMRVSGKGSSKYKGVSWHKAAGKWSAQITLDNKKKHLGLFEEEISAALAYDTAAKEFYKDFAHTNFKKDNLTNEPT